MSKVLVTAGSTKVMIDRVRCVTNIFKGTTGWEIASELYTRGHDVFLLTSNMNLEGPQIKQKRFRTYNDLHDIMGIEIAAGNYDVVIHSAAVSDYQVEGTYWMEDELSCDKSIVSSDGEINRQVYGGRIDSSTKISSSNNELFLRLIPTEKIIDKIRSDWGFKGKLVKFKLQVGMTDEELLDVAYKSMQHSNADFIVANCLEWARDRAFIINGDPKLGGAKDVERNFLPSKLADELGL